MTKPKDQPAREQAARVFDRNVVVTAGAGTGKTTLLVERLLNLVLGEGVRLPSVVALTFTEKAASEMRERLAAQLSRVVAILGGAARGTDPASFSLDWLLPRGLDPATIRARALEALDDLDAASIGTIHAACADLLRRHPAAARLDPAFEIDDGGRALRLHEEEWVAFQAETLREGPQAEAWRLVLASERAQVVADVAWKLLSCPGPPARSAAAEASARARATELLASCAKVERLTLSANASACVATVRARLEAFLSGGPSALRDTVRARPWSMKSIPKPGAKCEDREFASEVMTEGFALAESLASVDEPLVAAVLSLAGDLAKRTQARLDREGVVTFDGLLLRARDVLRDDLSVRAAEQSRIAALLLDEVQDTDPRQYEIAFLLAEDPAARVPAGGDAWEARLAPGRLFVVGDLKQSIYRFRGADIAACGRATELMRAQGATCVSLVANFRSRPGVLGPVNALCAAVITERPPYQPAYEPLEPAVEPRGERHVELWTVRGARHAEERRLAEGRAVAAEVRGWIDAGLARDHGGIAVLLRAMTGSEPYLRAFAEAGIPFVTQGGKEFYRRDEVVQAIALLRCLVSPHDGAAVLAVLRSACGGCSDRELRRFAELSGSDWSLPAHRRIAAAGDVPRVARALAGLDELSRAAARLPADEAVRVALLDAPCEGLSWRPRLLAVHAASRGGAQRVANLEKLADAAEDMARREGLSLARVVQRLAEEAARSEEQGESPLADESVDAVRIMSVHQAKGLEFPVVVLPDAGRQRQPPRGGLSVDARGALAVRLPGGATNFAHVERVQEARDHDEAEGRRLLYVAATRAREKLVVVNSNERPNVACDVLLDLASGWGYDATAGTVRDARVTHRVIEAGEEPEGAGAEPAGVEELSAAVLAHDGARARMARSVRAPLSSASGVHQERVEQERPYARTESGVTLGAGRGEAAADAGSSREGADLAPSRAGVDLAPPSAGVDLARPREGVDLAPPREGMNRPLARATGVAVHLALQAGEIGDGESLARFGRRAATLIAEESGADAEAVSTEVESLLRSLAGSPIAKALAGSRVLARELPFLLREHDGADWQGFIDLVIEKSGETWVVDWKTDRDEVPARHAAQLRLYAEAVRRWRGLPEAPRQALAYVHSGRWVELDARTSEKAE